MWRKDRIALVFIGVIFHVYYLWSIFDIYFVSPLVHGMQHFQSTTTPPAKRLFLIVADGLRADTTFDKVVHPTTGKSEFLAPYIRSLVENNATYGISHTRMPTESRPGHVAMIAGFYEDVSAVTKGWKENPVDFDSVFNQTSHTYSFGSPDILPMFKDGASDPSRVDAWMYGHEFEDFTQSSIELDAYVFRHLDQLFQNSTANASLNAELRQSGNVFFLHLLGCDTAGHSYRPYSAEYYDNVKYIDEQIEQMLPKVKEFFGDDDTAFIFTADHGMSAFGSHGDGHPNNTRTPLVAWGAGLNKPIRNKVPIYDNYTENWELHGIKRNDVNQADIASLMSYLIGINYPANSVGELPLAYINDSEISKLQALFNNAKEILEQYIVKEAEISKSQLYYKEYWKFAEKPYENYIDEIEYLIDQILHGDEELEQEAIKLTEELIQVSLEGLQYMTTYNWRFLRSVVTLGFLGWIVYSFTTFLKLFVLKKDYNIKASLSNSAIVFGLTSSLNYMLFYQKAPFNYYMYVLFPIFFWSQVSSKRVILKEGINELFKGTSTLERIALGALTVAMYEGIVYGFFHRWVFTVIFNILAFYPLFCGVTGYAPNVKWILTSAAISIFTLFDAVKIESLAMINISGLILILGGIYAIRKVYNYTESYTRLALILQVVLIALMQLVTNKSVVSLQNRNGLPDDARIGGWVLIVLSLIVMPLIHYISPSSDYRVRYLTIYLTFAPAFLILTISFESFFYFLFTAYVLQWIQIETRIRALTGPKDERQRPLQLVRVSVIGFFLLQVAFFGTGNVASISSFSLDSVYRLMPIFDPFPMGALLLAKLVIPYIILSTGLGLMNMRLQIEDYTISSLIISTSDILSLNFFYLLKTEGSWLDIGVTISNYCLAILCSLLMLILEVVSHFLISNVRNLEDAKPQPVEKRKIN
ncbi:HDL374Cp [Eremothecium sinecaudum]|uniref:GPI ethanolamine phosphate transferase 1 n=1 Tax=Eremothecium sinecaudum TaxID=45286 RepID=A0A120K242_9SACH|nr:HDL374Cp [Eremothecium sinecaudum]AMD20370.1 HDL374Cp [Eremothecium sinecaudum]